MTTNRPAPDPRLGNLSPPNTTSQNAALQGASMAFNGLGKPPVKPKPQIHNYSGQNGALAAATWAGGGARQKERNISTPARLEDLDGVHRLGRQDTGSSVGSRSYVGSAERPGAQKRLSQIGGRGVYLSPYDNSPEQLRSPSVIAATLAASRSASLSPNVTGQEIHTAKPRRPASYARTPSVRSANSSRSSDHGLDMTPIPATTSLIGMFEQKEVSPSAVKRLGVKRAATATPPRITRRSISPSLTRSRTPPALAQKPRKPSVKAAKPTLATMQSVSEQSEAQKPAPPTRKPAVSTTKPIPIPSTPRKQTNDGAEDDDQSSNDSFVSASSYKPSWRAEIATKRRTATSSHSYQDVDALANAIVASSLASSRAASPSRSIASSLYPPLPPPRRHGTGLFHHSHHPKDISVSRTPSPAKQGVLRTTMRKPKSKEALDENDKRRGRKNFMVKKHPNKHHEGDRKRWRDTITERERKRYEAVWASNKGLLLSPDMPGSENVVASLVVRDVYSRSRLDTQVLEEVYELVDRGKVGRLEREEFVVGLWLIDQRLKGRKLPIRVSDSVWKSVGAGLSGIKVRRVKH